jgi:uncharacterized membrane protein YphA (DoxX/SURF4 family)
MTKRRPSRILYCFAFLYFVFAGGGAWSLDALLAHALEHKAGAPVGG